MDKRIRVLILAGSVGNEEHQEQKEQEEQKEQKEQKERKEHTRNEEFDEHTAGGARGRSDCTGRRFSLGGTASWQARTLGPMQF